MSDDTERYEQLMTPHRDDPLGQFCRVSLKDARGPFELPSTHTDRNTDVLWMLRDIDRGWWGIFRLPRQIPFVMREAVLEIAPEAILHPGETP